MSERERPSTWRKSSFSQNGDCAEWCLSGELILLRSSKDPAGPVLQFTRTEWQAFVSGMRAGEADLE
jgi:predicted secreted Zn-dependent protease